MRAALVEWGKHEDDITLIRRTDPLPTWQGRTASSLLEFLVPLRLRVLKPFTAQHTPKYTYLITINLNRMQSAF